MMQSAISETNGKSESTFRKLESCNALSDMVRPVKLLGRAGLFHKDPRRRIK